MYSRMSKPTTLQPNHACSRKKICTLSTVFVLLMLLVIVISAIEITVYKTPNWFRNEYEKYSVLEDVRGEMSMESALEVTDEMMKYLRGDRKDLVVMTTLDGKNQEFFSQREKDHLADCRKLFIGGLYLRRIAGVIAACLSLWMCLLSRKSLQNGVAFSRSIPRVMGITAFVGTVMTVLIARDFDAAFIRFHHIFFDNDKWLLDPKKDNLINLLPEGFFMDTATRILLVALGLALLLCLISFLVNRGLLRWMKRQPRAIDGVTRDEQV